MTHLDIDELKVELYERGVELDISRSEGVVLSLTDRKTKHPIGVAKGFTIEQALSTLITKLSFNKTLDVDNIVKFDGLSRL